MKKIIFLIIGIIILIGAYFLLDSILFDGVRPQKISSNGFQANYYHLPEGTDKTAVVIVGGGAFGDFWASEFAKAGHVGLSLPYNRLEGLPDLIEEIPLEYFEKAIDWLAQQQEVDPKKIIVMGASNNAELALVLGASFPDKISGTIAYCPSSVSWSNTTFPWSSEEIKPKWTLKGIAIPFIAMEKIKGNETDKIETLPYWNSGLDDTTQVNQAAIPVEKINGPIILLTPEDDKVWPSLRMSKMIENRLDLNNFSFSFQNIIYPNSGHTISSQYSDSKEAPKGNMTVEGKSYEFELGGTPAGILEAQVDSRKKIMEFVNKL